MNWSEGTIPIGNNSVYYQEWQPKSDPLARVLLIHGLGEHSGRYSHVGDFFTQSNISLTAFDLLGHGRTDGQRGHADSYEDYCRIIDHFLEKLQDALPSVPLILYGHSLGGMIALYYALHRKSILAKAIISTSPGLEPGFKVPAWKTTVGNLLYAIVPKFSMDNGLPVDFLSHDKNVVEHYKKDSLNHPFISARMGMDLIRNGKEISNRAGEFITPLLLMVGSDDRLINPQAIYDFGEKTSATTTLKVWEGGFHELHNEPFKNDVLAYTKDWILQQGLL